MGGARGGAVKQQTLISSSSGVWKSKIKAPADRVSAEGLLLGLYLHTAERDLMT